MGFFHFVLIVVLLNYKLACINFISAGNFCNVYAGGVSAYGDAYLFGCVAYGVGVNALTYSVNE